MKHLFTLHIVNLEGRHCYYSTGISVFSIPFHLANKIEILKLNVRKKESKNFFPQFVAFQKTFRHRYKVRHSIRNLFHLETTGKSQFFNFQKIYTKNLREINQ